MFEDRMKEKAAEAGKARAAGERKANCSRLAKRVSDDLTHYIGKNLDPSTIEVGVRQNLVEVRKKTSADQMVITVKAYDPPKFNLSIRGPFKFDQKGMVDTVVEWMK